MNYYIEIVIYKVKINYINGIHVTIYILIIDLIMEKVVEVINLI